jgi:hypothetical protein
VGSDEASTCSPFWCASLQVAQPGETGHGSHIQYSSYIPIPQTWWPRTSQEPKHNNADEHILPAHGQGRRIRVSPVSVCPVQSEVFFSN